MPLVLADRVKETTTSTGVGPLVFAGPVAGYQSFSVVGDGNTTYYAVASAETAEWEVGIGTYNAATGKMDRTVVLSSSNANAIVDLSAGTKEVFTTLPASKAVTLGIEPTFLLMGA